MWTMRAKRTMDTLKTMETVRAIETLRRSHLSEALGLLHEGTLLLLLQDPGDGATFE